MSLYSVVRYFKKKGLEVTALFPTEGILCQKMRDNGIEVKIFRFVYEVCYVKRNLKYLSLPLLWFYDFFAFPLLLWKIHRIDPDIIYTNSSNNAFGLWISKILRKKHVQHVREFMKEDFGASYIFGRENRKKHILKSDKVIYVSNAVAKVTTDGVHDNGIVIYNGVRTPDRIKSKYHFSNNLRLGIVGYLDKSKQQDLAIKYMAEIVKLYPGLTLRIIGDRFTSYTLYIKKLVSDLHLHDNIIFEGFVNGEDNIYDKMDVLFMCSRMEAFGRVTVEAMRRNVPVIGFDAGGTSELIEDNVTGFKFKSCEDVINALNTLINNPSKTKMIIDAAKKKADNDFSEESYASRVYDFVINGN